MAVGRVPAPEQLVALGHRSGLDVVGITGAEPFDETRAHLERRREAGLHGGMQFTYRNPARSTDPSRALPGARALVVAARSYRTQAPIPPDGPHGAVARYSWRDHYAPLRTGLEAVADALRADGWAARVLVDDNALVDRAAAHRAGLGWFGKNTVLLLPGRGSWFVLGSVVTDAPLPARSAHPAGAPVPDGCGRCTRCLDACPTGALVAPGVLDARRCLAWLLEAPGPFPPEFRAALGGRIYGCDDCQEVCPPNRTADRRSPPPAGAGEEAHVNLLEVMAASDSEILERHGRWYVPGRQARYVRRNALVALGNVGDGSDPPTVAALQRALADPDPLVRSHAVWAAARLGRADLARAREGREEDPAVLEELARV